MLKINNDFNLEFKISYLNLLAEANYSLEFNRYYDEEIITNLINESTPRPILEKVKNIITYRKKMLELAKESKEGIKR